MKDSRWYSQVGQRAETLIKMMKETQHPKLSTYSCSQYELILDKLLNPVVFYPYNS